MKMSAHDHEARRSCCVNPAKTVLDLEFAPRLERAARHHEAGREHGLRDLERQRAQDRDEVHDDRDHDDHEDRDDPHERRLATEPPALGDPLDARAGGVLTLVGCKVQSFRGRCLRSCGAMSAAVLGREVTPRSPRQQARATARA